MDGETGTADKPFDRHFDRSILTEASRKNFKTSKFSFTGPILGANSWKILRFP